MCKVFISGRVSGLPYDYAKAKFDKAERYFLAAGYQVFNPTEVCKLEWSWVRCMIVCLWYLFQCDTVAFLDNWKESRGARIEHFVAKVCRKTIVEQIDYKNWRYNDANK